MKVIAKLLTRIVTVAEDVGKQVYPVVLPTNNPLYAIATTRPGFEGCRGGSWRQRIHAW